MWNLLPIAAGMLEALVSVVLLPTPAFHEQVYPLVPLSVMLQFYSAVLLSYMLLYVLLLVPLAVGWAYVFSRSMDAGRLRSIVHQRYDVNSVGRRFGEFAIRFVEQAR